MIVYTTTIFNLKINFNFASSASKVGYTPKMWYLRRTLFKYLKYTQPSYYDHNYADHCNFGRMVFFRLYVSNFWKMLSFVHAASAELFLAVQNSSIGDLVTDWSLSHRLLYFLTYKERPLRPFKTFDHFLTILTMFDNLNIYNLWQFWPLFYFTLVTIFEIFDSVLQLFDSFYNYDNFEK